MGIVGWTALVAAVVAALYVEYHLIASAVERGYLDASRKRDRGTTTTQGIGHDLAWRIGYAFIAVTIVMVAAWMIETSFSDGREEPRRSFSSSE